MKIRLNLAGSGERRRLTALEAASGSVTLHLSADAVVEVEVSLKGVVSSTVDNEPELNLINHSDSAFSESHQILNVRQQLVPAAGRTCTPKQFSKGTHVLVFNLAIPPLAACPVANCPLKHQDVALPPSFSERGRNGALHIEYTLEAKATRTSTNAFRRSSTAVHRRPLDLNSLNPPLPLLWMGSPGASSEVSRCILLGGVPKKSERSTSSPPSNISHAHLPASPEPITVHARLPSPAILYTGESLPLTLSLRGGATEISHIELRKLAVLLRSRTALSVKGRQAILSTSTDLVRRSGLREVVHGPDFGGGVAIGTDLISAARVSEDMVPSFTTCMAIREYVLEVVAGFVSTKGVALEEARLALNVEVHTGKTGLGTQRQDAAETERALSVPLRIGSLNHLRTQGGQRDTVEREELPPYSPRSP